MIICRPYAAKYAPEDVTIRGEQGHFYTLECVNDYTDFQSVR
jgi:hypothetical protein